MSAEQSEPKRNFFKMPQNLAELSDVEIEDLAEKIIMEFLSRQR
ncbi:hypothetical protein MCEJIRE27_00485 [Candidatus Nanopelagicaceae bacterium]